MITLVGAAFTLGYGVLDRGHLGARAGEMMHIAQNLARYGEYSNPFPAHQTGPTALATPVYPIFLSIFLITFGPTWAGMALVLVGALIYGVHAALLVQLSSALLQDRRPGIWAAVVVTVFPAIRFMPVWEAVPAAVGLLAFCLISSRWLCAMTTLGRRSLLMGMMTGLLLLLNPLSALVAFIWVVSLFRARWQNLRKPLIAAACFALMSFATPLPWVLRNQIVLGAPVIKSDLGMVLDASNNDCAASSFVLNFRSGCNDRHHPYNNREQSDLVAAMGEANYDMFRVRTALNWVRSNKEPFLRLTARRVVEFWFPNAAEAPYAFVISGITLLSLGGFVMMAKRHGSFLWFTAWVSLLYPLIYYVVFSDTRYRIPILWISLLGAGYFLQAIYERLESWCTSGKR
ncbi:MAG: hypothetical protein LLG20_05930 [Acidobacteriales bacterium]|nr:hypothetical protein [Terriglobales bacterium]